MALLLAGSETLSGTNSGSFTIDATGTNRIVIVMCSDLNNQASDHYTVTVDGTTPDDLLAYTRIGSIGRKMLILKDADIVGTEATIVFTASGSSSGVSVSAVCISGVDQTTPTLTVDTDSGYNDATATNTIAGNDATTMLVGMSHLRVSGGVIDASSYPNQIAMSTITGSLYFGDAAAWTYATGGSLSADFNTGTNTTWTLDGVQVLEGGVSAPIFADPSPITNKVGDVVSEDANDWYTTSGGTLDTFADVGASLPAGLSINATSGLITGTLSEAAGTVNVSITASDDNGATQGDFDWVISNYALKFENTTKLLNTTNNPYNPATTVNFSAILGQIDDVAGLGAVDATVHDWPAESVTDGVVTLTNASLVAGTYTVFAQDVTDSTILGVYEIVAE